VEDIILDVILRVCAGLILVVFVIGPISVAIGALLVHLWRRWRSPNPTRKTEM